MSYKSNILLRVRIAYVVMMLISVAIIYRIVVIQTIDGGKWKKKAESIGLEYKNVKATRGSIYSDNGSLLATSLPFYKVAFDPSRATEKTFNDGVNELAERLSKHFGDYSALDYKRRLKKGRDSGRRYLALNRKEINYQVKKKMSQWPIFREGRMKGGVIFEKVDTRYHPFQYLAFRTIGSINEDNRGVVGLEYSFNKQLMGRNGKTLHQRISGGGSIPVFDGTEVKSQNGYDVVSTIDVNLQDVSEEELLKALLHNDADYGCVVVMEVSTGEIKAISNLSKNSNGKYKENYNFAVGSQGSREPGSTFKLASMIALFEETNVSLYDTIDTGKGTHQFYDQVMKDHKPGGYGKISVQQVFEKSSNIGTAKLIVDEFGDKPQAFIDHLTRMGLTKPLGFQLKGEGKPYIKNPSDSTWSGTSLPWMSHGYALTMTPLHTLALYNAVANDGKMIQPMLVRSIKSADKVIEKFDSKVINEKICSQITLNKVREMLEGVVERGTAKNISDSYYQIAGKTGTAKHVKDGRYINKYYTSFAGYFPADQPKYSCIVVIDNPKSYRIYGSDVAAPVFKNIADKIYAIDLELNDPFVGQKVVEGVFPVIQSGEYEDLSQICNTIGISNHLDENADYVKAKISNNSITWRKKDALKNTVPDVMGMTLRDALFLLENKNYEVNYSGSGRVLKQSLLPGTKAKPQGDIKLTLG